MIFGSFGLGFDLSGSNCGAGSADGASSAPVIPVKAEQTGFSPLNEYDTGSQPLHRGSFDELIGTLGVALSVVHCRFSGPKTFPIITNLGTGLSTDSPASRPLPPSSPALDHGAPAHEVKEILGHVSLATSSRCTHARSAPDTRLLLILQKPVTSIVADR